MSDPNLAFIETISANYPAFKRNDALGAAGVTGYCHQVDNTRISFSIFSEGNDYLILQVALEVPIPEERRDEVSTLCNMAAECYTNAVFGAYEDGLLLVYHWATSSALWEALDPEEGMQGVQRHCMQLLSDDADLCYALIEPLAQFLAGSLSDENFVATTIKRISLAQCRVEAKAS